MKTPILRQFVALVCLSAGAQIGLAQGAATLEEQARAPKPDGPETYIGRGPMLPNLTASESYGPTPAIALLVGEKGGGLLSIVDPDKLEIVGRIYFGGQPHEVATDGRNAYITSALPNGIVVVDVKEQKTLDPIEYGAFGAAHALWTAGGKIYASHEGTLMLSRYNPELKKFDWSRGIGFGSHMLIVSPDERIIYLASSGTKQFVVMESGNPIASTIPAARGAPRAAAAPGTTAPRGGGGRGGWAVTSFPTTDGRLEGFAISPDGKEYWGLNINEKSLMIASIPDKKILETIPMETVFSNRLQFTPDGNHVLISELMGPHPTMMIYDAKTRKLVKRLDPGAGGEGVFIDPRPEKAQAFYAVSNGNKLAVIDLNTFTIKKYITGLRTPDGMAWYTAKP